MNNILEIDNNIKQNGQINNNDINDINQGNIDNEAIPILLKSEASFDSVEKYYKAKYPEYKIVKFRNFIFIKMGNLLTFKFDEKDNYAPRFSIGPHWYFSLILFLLIFLLILFFYIPLFNKQNINTYKKMIFYLLTLSVYFFVFSVVLVHPKVVMNKIKTKKEYGLCSICKCYFDPYKNVEHCQDCGVCFENMDHHCMWVGKCIAKNNIFYFYGMLINVGILYGFIFYCVILSIKEKKQNKNI